MLIRARVQMEKRSVRSCELLCGAHILGGLLNVTSGACFNRASRARLASCARYLRGRYLGGISGKTAKTAKKPKHAKTSARYLREVRALSEQKK